MVRIFLKFRRKKTLELWFEVREILTFSTKAAQNVECIFSIFSNTLLSSYERLFIPPRVDYLTVLVIKSDFILVIYFSILITCVYYVLSLVFEPLLYCRLYWFILLYFFFIVFLIWDFFFCFLRWIIL